MTDIYDRLRASGLSEAQANKLIADRREFQEQFPEPEAEVAVTAIQRDLWAERSRRAKDLLNRDHPISCDTWEGGSCDCGYQDAIYEFLEDIARSS